MRNTTLQSFIGAIILLMCSTDVLVAQNIKLKQEETTPIFSLLEGLKAGVDYEKGEIVVKLKPQFRDAISTLSPLSEYISEVSITPVKTIFKSQTIQSQRARGGKNLVTDLSLFHNLRVAPDADLNKIIRRLYKTGMIEYAEPRYIYQYSYTPDDPEAGRQYYLDAINAYDAWDISKGDSNIVIGIVDSGFDFNHPDLANKVKYNYDDPIDGIDNDNDGYVDNFRGWDFVGDDYQNIQDDNDPQLTADEEDHGVAVSGCAAADTDNGTGIAGVGFNCMLLPSKNSDAQGFGLVRAFDAVVYMAEQGVDVINCSWGGYRYSQFGQDIINYAVLERDVVVVCAAGNGGSEDPMYPAAYENALSVGATDEGDRLTSFSERGVTLDILAPGIRVYTTRHSENGGYSNILGTSFSSPIVAGAVGLVKSVYPDFNALQLAELVRVTSDDVTDRNSNNKDKIGKGRLNLNRAVTEQLPAVKLTNAVVGWSVQDEAYAGDTATLRGDFINYLWPADESFTVTCEPIGRTVEMIDDQILLGAIGTMETRPIEASEGFRMALKRTTKEHEEITFKLVYEQAGGYRDVQYLVMELNPSFARVRKNRIATSVGHDGTIGWHGDERALGNGHIFDGEVGMAWEMAPIMGTSTTKVVNNARGIIENEDEGPIFDNDFVAQSPVRINTDQVEEGSGWYKWVGEFDDSGAGRDRLNINVTQNYWASENSTDDNYVMVEYNITNTGSEVLENFHAGIFADWDIGNPQLNRADWNPDSKVGYVFSSEPNLPYGGLAVLSGTENYFAFNNNQDDPNTIFGIYDGFDDQEKFTSIAAKTNFTTAGLEGEGGDVSHVAASGPYNIAPGSSIRCAFAIITTDNLDDMTAAADRAAEMYQQLRNIGQEVSATEAESLLARQMVLFPNPGTNRLNIQLENEVSGNYSVSIVNATGQEILTKSFSKSSVFHAESFDMSEIPSGIYFIRVSDGKITGTKRWVKK